MPSKFGSLGRPGGTSNCRLVSALEQRLRGERGAWDPVLWEEVREKLPKVIPNRCSASCVSSLLTYSG